MKRPLVLFDGDCGFCRMWISRWKGMTGDRVDYRAFQEVEDTRIAKEELQRAIHYIDADGKAWRGAHAVLRFLAAESSVNRFLLKIYERVPLCAGIANGCYALVADHRSFFSWWTRVLWGGDVQKPTFALSSWIFLRLLGLTWLIAFGSLWKQAQGLIGSHGILPFAELLEMAKTLKGFGAYYIVPSLLWLHPTDSMLSGIVLAGVICAIALMAGVAQRAALLLCWILYLSLVSVGRDFLSFQWDSLLLEAGFLSLFLVPGGWSFRMIRPSAIGRFLLLWLLFRVMFSSGVVKLSSGDPAWRSLTALNYHYFTQPLPNPVSLYMQQLPAVVQKISAAGMLVIELIFPFFIFGPRRLRILAFIGLAGLQVMIFLTGNYGFFSLLNIALCILLLDDHTLRFRKTVSPVMRTGYAAGFAALILFLFSLIPLVSCFRVPLPEFPLSLYEATVPFRLVNGYGLFAVMTTSRREITIQGSTDGKDWKTWEFPFKPGPLRRPPPFALFYMPRLDWQMWFAALGGVRENRWFTSLLARLLEGSPPVLALMEGNPFSDDGSPRYIRARLEDYHFTSAEERAKTGDWWTAQPAGVYLPEAALNR